MYEDALKYCNFSLRIDKNNEKSLYRKATSLAYLFKFDESMEIFNKVKHGD